MAKKGLSDQEILDKLFGDSDEDEDDFDELNGDTYGWTDDEPKQVPIDQRRHTSEDGMESLEDVPI